MKSLAVLGLLASLAFAQDYSSNPLIPEGLSDSCNKFYVQLNANTGLAQCLGPLKQATSGSYGTSSLNNICSATTCDATTIGAQLSSFQQACQTELTDAKNAKVIITYDSLYLLSILPKVVCLKDTSGNYCLANSSTSSTKRASLDRRGSQQVFIPDAAQFNQKNIPFLGLQTGEAADKLCTPCTRQIMVPGPTNLAPFLMAPACRTANSSPASLLSTALSTRSAVLPSSAAKYKLLVASRQAQHHARPMAALHLLAQQLLPPPRVPLHFCRRKHSRRQDEPILGCRYVFMGIRGHSHLYFRYLSLSL